MINGYATISGTKEFAAKFNESNFKEFLNFSLSSVGMGTYLGEPNDTTDKLVKDAIQKSILSGINIIDTAINYRAQKAERMVGKAISELITEGKITRQELFICTKNGYVTNDADTKQDFWEYVKEEYTDTGIIQQGDISSGYHCMKVSYLADQLERSLQNLDMDCVDLMYLHNAVEGQKDLPKSEFLERLYKVFEFYENKRKEGKIKFYGMATWECFRVPKDNPQHLSLHDTVKMVEQIAGKDHGFKFIQLPYNMYYDQALLKKYQNEMSILESAQRLDIGVFTSVPFMQGRLLQQGVMPEFIKLKPSLRALQFIRSTPGVIAPLVGQKSPDHVKENLEIFNTPIFSKKEFDDILQKMI